MQRNKKLIIYNTIYTGESRFSGASIVSGEVVLKVKADKVVLGMYLGSRKEIQGHVCSTY